MSIVEGAEPLFEILKVSLVHRRVELDDGKVFIVQGVTSCHIHLMA